MLAKETCPTCKGKRYVVVARLSKGGVDFHKCPKCQGVGYTVKQFATC